MKNFLFSIIIILNIKSYSQNKFILSDNEFEKLQGKVKSQIANNLDSAFFYCSKIEKSNNNLHKAFANGYKAYYYQFKKDTISSNKFLNYAETILNKENTSLFKNKMDVQLLNLKGLIFRKRGRFSEAINVFNKGKMIAQKINDQKFILKFNNNIAAINSDIGNKNFAIKVLKENNLIIEKLKFLYSKEEYNKSKSIINYNLGNYYQDIYNKSGNNKDLDSSDYYYQKTLVFSDNLVLNKIKTTIDIGSNNVTRKKFEEAEKFYNTAFVLSVENEFIEEQIIAKYNLGNLNYIIDKFDNSLVHFRHVDSLSNLYNIKKEEFILSNYYQSKIYFLLNDYNKAKFHLEIYSDEFSKHEKKMITQSLETNNSLISQKTKDDAIMLNKSLKRNFYYSILWKIVLVILFLILLAYLIKTKNEKKKANNKIEELLKEFKSSNNFDNKIVSNKAIVIDDVKEKRILEKLMVLINKELFLNQDFNLQTVAKRIKTNTTYLSYVINKNYQKSFSEFSNELKINYAVNQIINNPIYRKYSTQAIAESVGFKNNVSFTKSFKKRAGVTPAQFILKMKDKYN